MYAGREGPPGQNPREVDQRKGGGILKCEKSSVLGKVCVDMAIWVVKVLMRGRNRNCDLNWRQVVSNEVGCINKYGLLAGMKWIRKFASL